MDHKEIETTNWLIQLIPIGFAALLASFGGAIHYFNKIDKNGMKFKLFNFVLEIATSAFVGIVTFMLCDSAGWGWEYTAAVVAISGHMGARALMLAENAVIKPLIRKFGNGYSEEET